MNQVALVGRMTKDPVLRELRKGRLQTTFVLAVNRHFRNANGEMETDFIMCTVWGKLAENTVKYCGKGSLVSVSGRIQSRSFEREDGSRVYLTEVVGDKVRFIITKNRADDKDLTIPTEAGDTSGEEFAGLEAFELPENESEELPIT